MAVRIAALGVVVLSLASILAFKKIFPHNGEDTLNLVPETAVAAGTLDLDPAPSQVLAFKQIDDAIKRNGFGDSFEAMAKSGADSITQQQALWALTKHSMSMCVLQSPDAKSGKPSDEPNAVPSGAVLVPVTDGPAAEKILKSSGRPEFWKGTRFYHLFHKPVDAMVLNDTIVISNQPWAMHEIGLVASGATKPLSQLPAFQEARAKEPTDASLIFLMSPKFGAVAKSFAHGKLAQVSGTGWSSAAMTVQDGGLAFTMHGQSDPNQNEIARSVASIKPIRADLMQHLPAGAFGVWAMSQPSQYLKIAEASLKGNDYSKTMKKGEAEFQKQTGIDVEKDVMPGLNGDAVFAAYPSKMPTAGVDFLMVADNQNGADPEHLALKLQSFIDRQASTSKEFGKSWVTAVPLEGGTEFKLSPTVERKMHDSMKIGPSAPIHGDALMSGKTVAWATVGGSFFIATSQKLLETAIAAYGGKGATLANDPAISAGVAENPGNQSFAVASISRIAESIRNTANPAKMSADQAKMFDQILGVFDRLDKPLYFQAATTPDGASAGTAFIPLDYDKLIDLIGTMSKSGQPASNPA
jgi:hypothetical protein